MGEKVKDNNYVVIHGWMINELGLKGNQLLVYAIIHGFSQDGESRFHGGLKYLEEWCSSTKNTIINALKELEKAGLITKHEIYVANNIKYCEYSVTDWRQDKTTENSGVKIEPNNKVKNNSNIYKSVAEDIIRYFNSILGSRYTPTSKNLQLIIARLKEGFTEQDFKIVIDSKYDEWYGNPNMKPFLRPSTIFAPSHFDEYLNNAPRHIVEKYTKKFTDEVSNGKQDDSPMNLWDEE